MKKKTFKFVRIDIQRPEGLILLPYIFTMHKKRLNTQTRILTFLQQDAFTL